MMIRTKRFSVKVAHLGNCSDHGILSDFFTMKMSTTLVEILVLTQNHYMSIQVLTDIDCKSAMQ